MTTIKGRFESEVAHHEHVAIESLHDYTQDPQRFEGLNAHTKQHCQLLLTYAQENLCQDTSERVDEAFNTVWDETMRFPQKLRHEARTYLHSAFPFIDKSTLHAFLTHEALSKDEEEMYYEYGVATPEGIYNEH